VVLVELHHRRHQVHLNQEMTASLSMVLVVDDDDDDDNGYG